ncbi:MAG TPA: efflux RND transporter periplasmic adaptor subunit [Vicinamibacteria bacterium]|nr:efflux RND transporter periplasmic adaptor subunit [Vicinamibacteria bacterium]
MSDPQREGDVEGEAGGRGSRVFRVFVVAGCAFLVLGALSVLQRRSELRELAAETERQSVPSVAVIHPTAEPEQEDLVLPGTLQAYVESPIYARTNGYLKIWYHDIGSRVRKGERLAELDTPEVDQQLAQARADLATATATARLAGVTATRLLEVLKTNGVSKQEADTAVGDLEAKRAIADSAAANVRRLEDLESFKHIVAPFEGVITRRNVDIGTLVNAGNGGQSQLLFTLAQTDPIRVYVSVPERYSPSIRAGLGAHLALAAYPGREFEGQVVRSAEAIDPGTRTLLTEVNVGNKEGVLFPGGYAQVRLQVKVVGQRLQVPINALLFRSEGLRAVVVDSNQRAHLRALTIGRDYGIALEVLDGLTAEDWIVLNPADSLDEGQTVRPAPVKAPAPADKSPAGAPREKAGA